MDIYIYIYIYIYIWGNKVKARQIYIHIYEDCIWISFYFIVVFFLGLISS